MQKPHISLIYEVFSFYRTPPTLLTFLPSHRNPAANDCRCLFPPPRHPLSAPPAAAAAAPDGRQKNGEGPLSGPSLRSKLRHCSRISEDSFHCMQVDTGSRSGETAGWFHPGYSDCFMTARLLKSLLKKRCAEPDSDNSRIIPIIQICNWSGTAQSRPDCSSVTFEWGLFCQNKQPSCISYPKYRKINRFHQKIYTIFSIFYFNRTLRALIPDIHVEDFMPVEIEPVPQRQRSHVLPVRFCQVAV